MVAYFSVVSGSKRGSVEKITFAIPSGWASRLALFDRDAIARTKFHVDQATLPSDAELAAALPEFFQSFGRQGPLGRLARLVELGLNTDGDLERRLGERVVEAAPQQEGG